MKDEYCPYCMAKVEPGEPCESCGLTAGSYTPNPRHLPPGTVLRERYLVGRVLGEGGFGITYIGRDLILDLKVAIKEYFPVDKATRDSETTLAVSSYFGTPSEQYDIGRTRFLREARTMARLDRQACIVNVKDFFEANNTAYIVMEYIDGTTFKDLVAQRGGKIPAQELLKIIEPLFGALSAMHEQKLLHRDISPDNLMLERGLVRLLDFGCARESANGDATMTIMLRHGYAPLEQYQSSSGAQGPWTDVYALAATIYYCLTGRKPPQAMDRLLEDEMVPPRKLGVELTEIQEEALLKGLSVHPRARYQSVEEFHTALYKQGVKNDSGGKHNGKKREEEKPDEKKPKEEKPGEEKRTEEKSDEEKPDEEKHKEEKPDKKKRDKEKPDEKKHDEVKDDGEKDDGKKDNGEKSGEEKDGGEKKDGSGEDKKDGGKEKPKRKINKPLVGVIAAACVLFGVLPKYLHLTGEQTPGNPSPSPSASSSLQGDSSAEDLSNPGDYGGKAVYVINWDFDHFRRLMEGSAPAIYIPDGSGLSIDEPIEITKPVVVAAGAELHLNAETTLSAPLWISEGAQMFNNHHLIISGGGLLEIEGKLAGSGLLQTADGGSLATLSQGHVEFNALWLEQDSDLQSMSGHYDLNSNMYVVSNEDQLFANATRVGSFDELQAAFGDPRTSAVIINRGFELQNYLMVNKPLLIPEGVTMSCRQNEGGLNAGQLVINRGELTGSFLVGEGGTWINYGFIDADVYAEGGCILNLGEMNLRYGQYKFAGIINLGNLRHERSGEDWEETYLDLIGGTALNLGSFTLASDCRMLLSTSGWFENRGEFDIEENARLESGTELSNSGSGVLTVHGEFCNDGVLTVDRPENLAVFAPGRINGGVIQVEGNGDLLAANELIDARILERIFPEPEVEASTVEEFQELLSREDAPPIRLMGPVKVEGDLTLRQDLVIEGGYLEVSGDLIVDGARLVNYEGVIAKSLTLSNGAALFHDGGLISATGMELNNSRCTLFAPINLNQGGLLVVNDSLMVNWGDLRACGDLQVDDGGYFYNAANFELLGRVSIGGGTFANRNWMDLYGADVGEMGCMYLGGGLFVPGEAEIKNRGSLVATYCDIQVDEGARIENDGSLSLCNWEWQRFDLGGEIVNRGSLHVGGEPNIIGTLVNQNELCIDYGTLHISGQLNNRGIAWLESDDAGYEGNWNGNPPTRR